MKNLGGIITWLFGMLLIISFTGIGSGVPSLSNSGGGNWQNYRDITITENSGSTLTDYQILVQIPSDKFPTNVRSDGADIRFVDESERELNYWIESWDYSGKNARIWVKVPNIPAGTTVTLRMYYRNPSASSSSSGDATFNFFDDFNRDLSKWTTVQGVPAVIENGEASIDDANVSYPRTTTYQTKNGIVETKINVKSTAGTPHWLIYGRWTSTSSYEQLGGRGGFNDFYIYDANTGALPINPVSWTSNAMNTWFLFQLKMNEGDLEGNVYDMKGTLLATTHASSSRGTGYVGMMSFGHTHFDDFRVREYTASEPTVSLGAEKPVATPTPTSTAFIPESAASSGSSSPVDTTAPVPPSKEPTIEPKPLLSVSQDPFIFNFGTMKAGETASQVLSVSNTGGETLTWGISDDQPWITTNPTSGSNSGTILININTAGLNSGSYSGTIIVTSNGGTKKGSVLLNIPDVSAAAPALTTAPSAAPLALPVASPVSLSQIVGVILVLGGLLLTALTTVKKDISLEVGVSEKTMKYVGGAGVLLVIIGAYMLLRTSGFM